MNTRTVAFEMEDGNEIEIDIQWSYSFTPGKLNAPMGDCYPDECETEIVLPDDLDKQLTDFFTKNVLPEWKKSIEHRRTVIECDGDLADWQREMDDDYYEDRD